MRGIFISPPDVTVNTNINKQGIYMLKIDFKPLSPEAKMPALATKHSAGFDLSASVACTVHPGETVMVQTGLAVAIPVGYVGMICPRSGLAKKNGITVTNAPGIIDADYRGELCVLLHNTSNTTFAVSIGDRIAQMVFTSVPTSLELCLVAELDETDRGTSGFGSSGVSADAVAG